MSCERFRYAFPPPTATPASVLTAALRSVFPPPQLPEFVTKPAIGRLGIAQTGLTEVRIDFDSAESIEIACSGFVAEPLRSIQRPSQPVLTLMSLVAANQMSELSKWLRLYFLASTAGITARLEPSPPEPSP